MRRLAYGPVVHGQITADGPDHDLARVQPDSNLHFDAVRAADLLVVALNGLLHGERGIAGPHGIVPMGDGGAKQRHNAIAEHLVDRPLIPMDGRHHPLQHGVEELARFLRIAVGQ
jgi:hypothetical protein